MMIKPLILVAILMISSMASAAEQNGKRFWIRASADSDGAIDYESMHLDRKPPTIEMTYKLDEPIKLMGATYTAIITEFALDCSKGAMMETGNYLFLGQDGDSTVRADLTLYDRVVKLLKDKAFKTTNPWEPMCILQNHGFKKPSLSLNEEWEEMASPTAASRVFEAPAARQYRDGLLLVKQKNAFPSDAKIGDKLSPGGIIITVFDCKAVESHLMISARLGMNGEPIVGSFGSGSLVTPKLAANRQRLMDACESMKTTR